MTDEKKQDCCGPDCCCPDCCSKEDNSHCEDNCCSHKNSGRILKFVLLVLALVCLAGIITVSILRDRIVNKQYRQVTITGQGRVSYEPDIAIVTLGVQIDKVAKAEDALNQLNSKVNSIIAAIKAAGISEENIQTQNYSLMPQYDYKNNVTVVGGYSANQQLAVKITGYDKDQAKLSQVIAVASKAGANQVLNLSFDVSNLNDLKQQARIKAIDDARAKSGALAAAADVKLDDISSWWENLLQAPTPYSSNYSGAMGAGGIGGGGGVPQTPSGSKEIIVEIGVTYNLK